MRSVLSFAVLSVLLLAAHGFKHPSWDEMRNRFNGELEKAKKTMSHPSLPAIPASLQNLVNQAKKKFEEHSVKNEMATAMQTMQKDLLSKMRNLAASSGMHIRDPKELGNLIQHMMYLHAHHNMQNAMEMQKAAQQLATQYMKKSRSTQDIHHLANGFSSMWHNYMRKFMEGTESILKKSGVSMMQEHMSEVLHHGFKEAMQGKSIMDGMMAVMKKHGVKTDSLDTGVKNELMSHFEKLKTEAKAELQKLLTAHKVSTKVDEVITAMQAKGKELMAKCKTVHAPVTKESMERLQHMAKKAFKMHGKTSGDHHKFIMRMHLMIGPAMKSHFHLIARIFKNHKLQDNHSVIHYTIFHRIRDDCEDCSYHHSHRHHHWWHKKYVRMGLVIGGSIFGVAVLIAAIAVMVHTIKQQRNASPRVKKEIFGDEKSSLPYSIMGEKDFTKA